MPSICGECPYQNRKGVLRKKALKLKTPDTAATLHGRELEPVALRRFCEDSGAEVVEYPCEYRKHPLYGWLGGTMDARVRLRDGEVVVVEIKCPISRPIRDEVPIHYVGQVQVYLSLLPDAPYALFVQYKPAGPRSCEKLQVTRVERDASYMALRLPSLKRFWNELQLWSGYVERVVIVMQRAWRCYRARKTRDDAARQCMAARLKCAHVVGRIAGFCRTKRAQRGMMVPPPESGGEYLVDSADMERKRHCARPRTDVILVICD